MSSFKQLVCVVSIHFVPLSRLIRSFLLPSSLHSSNKNSLASAHLEGLSISKRTDKQKVYIAMPPTLIPPVSAGVSDPQITNYPLPPPAPSNDNDDHDDNDDDDSVGSDDEHSDSHHDPTPLPLSSSRSSNIDLSVSAYTTSFATSTQSILSNSEITPSTTEAFSTTSFTSSAVRSVPTTSAADHSNTDSTPINQANPALETKGNSSPFSTAGIVLAAVFGFAALVTIFYFLFRLIRRRNANQAQSDRHEPDRSNTFNSQITIEKGTSGNTIRWPSHTPQETGIIFGRRSETNPRTPQQQQQNRGRFSFLNRRWYSTGTEFTRPNNNSSTILTNSVPSTSRSASRLFGLPFPLGLGLRHSRTALPPSSSSTTALNEHYTNDPYNVPSTSVSRASSQRSVGSGHARAYVHHNIHAPESAPRSTISSLSSRLFHQRPSTGHGIARSDISNISETSEMYTGSPSLIPRPLSISLEASREERRRSREGSQMPRLPLPVAVGERWSFRLSM